MLRTFTLLLLCSTSTFAIARAEDISTSTTAEITSATIADGSPGDVSITSAGSISTSETDGFVAVTMNSDNDFTNEGEIDIEDSDNAIGVLVLPGYSGTIKNTGDILVLETYEREDSDDDDDDDGPYAIGENRYGILLQSGGTYTGDIITDSGSQIQVEGNNSAGISLESVLDGSLKLDGLIYGIGDNIVGLGAKQNITGDVLISGAVSVIGENATALSLAGDIGGNLTVESTVSSTGFATTSSSNYIAPAYVDEDTEALADRIDAEDLLDNTATIAIGGSLGSGFLINGDVDDFVSEEDEDDETKDTVEDFDENRVQAGIYSYGSGPAVLISADYGDTQTGDLVLGQVIETVRDTLDDDDDDDYTETLATFTYDQGLINRGVISASGLNVGFEATALRVEGEQAGTAKSIITGGILNTGSISSLAYEADSTAVSIGKNAVVGSLLNEGTLNARTYTTNANSAVALLIEDGSELTSITNSGSISAGSVGRSGNVTGVRDESSNVTSFTNLGTIAVTQTTDGEAVDTLGDLVALDFSAHDASTAFTFVQNYETPTEDTNDDDEIDEYDVTSPFVVGDILLGAGQDNVSVLAGYISGDIDFGTGDSVLVIDDASITGDIDFADGTTNISLSEGTYAGDLTFTNVSGAIDILNGSDFVGRLITSNSDIALTINESAVKFEAGSASTLSSLNATGESQLVFEIDPDDTSTAMLTVEGNGYIGSEVVITPVLTSLPAELTTQTLVAASNLNFEGDYNELELSNIPWLYTTDLVLTDSVNDTLDLIFVRKTASELGLDTNETAAFSALMEIFSSDDELGAAIADITTEHDFLEFYDLLIPQRTDASTRFLEAQANGAFGALSDSLDSIASLERDGTRVWAQEYFLSLEQDTTASSPGYNGEGFGMAMGADRRFGPIDAIGVMLGFSSGDFEEKTGGNNPVSTTSVGLGGYVQESIGFVDLRLAGLVSKVKFDAHREIDFDTSLSYDLDAEWGGWSAAASASATSRFDLGPVWFRPKASIDWFSLSQHDYVESGGDGLLEAAVGDVETDRLTSSFTLALGRDWQIGNGVLRTDLHGGARQVLSSTPFSAEVSYLGSSQTFTLNAPDTDESAALFGVGVSGGSEMADFRLGYDLESSDTGTTHYLGGVFRVQF